MTEPEKILQTILHLRQFAKENSHHGLLEGLSVVFEEYINEVSTDETVRFATVSALKEGTEAKPNNQTRLTKAKLHP